MNGKMGTRLFREGLECFESLIFRFGETLGFSYNVAVRVIGIVIFSDEAITLARQLCECTNFAGHVLGDETDTVAIAGEYLDGICVVGVGGVGFHGGDKLATVVVYVFAVGDACNVEFYVVYTLKALTLGPDAHVVAFILDAEVSEILNAWFVNGMRSRCSRTVI